MSSAWGVAANTIGRRRRRRRHVEELGGTVWAARSLSRAPREDHHTEHLAGDEEVPRNLCVGRGGQYLCRRPASPRRRQSPRAASARGVAADTFGRRYPRLHLTQPTKNETK